MLVSNRECALTAERMRAEYMGLLHRNGQVTEERFAALARLHSGYSSLGERALSTIDDYLTGERL